MKLTKCYMVEGPDVYVPSLTGKLEEQQRLTIKSGILTSISSRQRSAISSCPLPEWTDFGPAICSLTDPYAPASCTMAFTPQFSLTVTHCLYLLYLMTCVVSNFGDPCFTVASQRLQNSLPAGLRQMDTGCEWFKCLLKTYVFGRWGRCALWLCFLADRTATQYDRLLAAACCPSVCPSVCNAVHCGSQGWCTRLELTPACS